MRRKQVTGRSVAIIDHVSSWLDGGSVIADVNEHRLLAYARGTVFGSDNRVAQSHRSSIDVRERSMIHLERQQTHRFEDIFQTLCLVITAAVQSVAKRVKTTVWAAGVGFTRSTSVFIGTPSIAQCLSSPGCSDAW